MRTLQPPGWLRPRGYANGITAEGRLVFVAGQIGWDATGTIVSDDLVEQPGRRSRTRSPCYVRRVPGPSTSHA